MKILIDPGHGGFDPGACANGMREADYVLEASRYLMNYLRVKGHQAHLTRSADYALGNDKAGDLAERCETERKCAPDLFLSIHCNAAATAAANGFEVWTSFGKTTADKYAETLMNAFHAAFPLRPLRRDFSDGDQDKESNFYVLKHTRCPAVLVELGFLTNAAEARWLRGNQIAIVQALAAGIDKIAEGL